MFVLIVAMQTSVVSSLLSGTKVLGSSGLISYSHRSILFFDNFENGFASTWSYVQQSTAQSETVLLGDYSAIMSNNSYGYVTLSESSIYVEMNFFVDTLPEYGLRLELLRLMDINGGDIGVVHLTSNELYLYRIDPNIKGIGSSQNLQEKTWYKIGFQYDAMGYHVLLNDIEIISDLVTTTLPVGIVLFGQYSSTHLSDLFIDDILISTELPIHIQPLPTPTPSSIPIETTLPWSIIGEDYLFYVNGDPDLIWTSTQLAKLTQWESNTMRVSFSFADSTPKSDGTLSHSIYDTLKMDRTLDLLGSVGVKGILNLHNVAGDMFGDVGSWKWINNWKVLAQTYLGDSRVVAFQIFNEPIPETWAVNGPVGAITSQLKLVEAFAYCIDEIRAIDPSRTIIYPVWYGCGIDYGSMTEWYNDLQSFSVVDKGNIVYDVIHPYYFENAWDMGLTPTQKVAYYRDYFLIPAIDLFGVDNVWIGETFAWPEYDGGTHDLQIEFLTEMINTCVEFGVGVQVFSYFGKSAWQNEALAASNYLD